jgi:hypothetical protein
VRWRPARGSPSRSRAERAGSGRCPTRIGVAAGRSVAPTVIAMAAEMGRDELTMRAVAHAGQIAWLSCAPFMSTSRRRQVCRGPH